MYFTCEYSVDWWPVHLLPSEDDNVEDVGDGAEDAHDQAEVAVDALVAVLQVLQVADRGRRAARRRVRRVHGGGRRDHGGRVVGRRRGHGQERLHLVLRHVVLRRKKQNA